MNKKTIIIYASILIMALLSFGAVAGQSHLDEAIQHAEAAVGSADGKSLAKHAEEAKTHAQAAKNDKTDAKHLDEGIKCLDGAIKEGSDGNLEAAKKEATDAVKHFKQAIK